MSVEYSLFLRDKPTLDRDSLGAMALELHEYTPRAGDAIEDETFRGEIRWELRAYGRISDFDEWQAFVRQVCKRYRGVIWSAATGDLERIDEKGIPPGYTDDELEEEYARDVAERAKLEKMVAGATSSPATMKALKRKEVIDSIYFRVSFTNLLVGRAINGEALKPWTWALPHLKLDLTVDQLVTPFTRARFAKKGPLAAAIVKRYETDQKRAATRVQRQKQKARDKTDAAFQKWLLQPDVDPPLIEKRRRGGEMLAGIPRSTAALAARGDLKGAIADYAQRYDLAEDVARKVVTANAAKFAARAKASRKSK